MKSIKAYDQAVAIPAALASAGITVDDVDLFELNEAFASQVGLYLFYLILFARFE